MDGQAIAQQVNNQDYTLAFGGFP